MRVNLAYGRGHLTIETPDERTTVIEPQFSPGLGDEKASVLAALDNPIGAEPLKDWIRSGDRVCIVFNDITRPTPNDRLIPWLLEYLKEIPRPQITLLNGLGSHRPNTRVELMKMLTPEIVANYTILNHDAHDAKMVVSLGTTKSGAPVLINRHLVEAHIRIVTGFIEPHFFAGFSGGPKGIMPAVAGMRTIMDNHGARNLAHPKASFGTLQGNPVWEEMRDVALRVGRSFLLNVTLNHKKQITGVFAGDIIAAHKAGARIVKKSAMCKVAAPFDIVVTTNSGYPLDLNLYQAVKGMSAGARIVKPGGLLIVAAECREGAPAGSPYDQLLREAKTPDGVLTLLSEPGFHRPEQWQAQIQALIQKKVEVMVHSSMPDSDIRAAHMEPCPDISAEIQTRLARLGSSASVAVLPQGPMTIPYL